MYQFTNQTNFYKGKVRDVYTIDQDLLVMIASNRISAFDVILPQEIPYKGQVLNQIAEMFLDATKDIIPNWKIQCPSPQTTIGLKCHTYPIEMVVRGNLTGHAWRIYKTGQRLICGVTMPNGLKENDYFPTPIITPTTKAHQGHDEDISKAEIISRKLVSLAEYEQLENYTLQLFERGKQIAAKQNLILVDTKYEFGHLNNIIHLIDEIHTPDSSRYFYAQNFQQNQDANLPQKQLSKEFVREWLMQNNFMGKPGEVVPQMNLEKVNEISQRYQELYNAITGQKFIPKNQTEQELFDKINLTLQQLKTN